MTKLRGEGLSAPSLWSSKSFPDGPFMTVPVLGCRSLGETYLSLANQSSTIRWGQGGGSEGGRSRIGSISLVAHGPKAFSLSPSCGTLMSAGWLPTSPPFLFVMVDIVVSPMKPATCSSCIQSLENNLYMHFKVQKTTMIRRHPIAPMTQTCKFSPSSQGFGLSHCKLSCRV